MKNLEKMQLKNESQKGTIENPYKVDEFETILRDGLWKGGYVKDLGMVEAVPKLKDDNTGVYGGYDLRPSEITYDYRIWTSLSLDKRYLYINGYLKDLAKEYAYSVVLSTSNNTDEQYLATGVTSSNINQIHKMSATVDLKKYEDYVNVSLIVTLSAVNTVTGHKTILKRETIYEIHN